MRMKAQELVETEIHELPNGGKMTVSPDGEVMIGKSVFQIRRFVFEYPDTEPRFETHLIGSRGSTYLLRPYIEKKGDSGIRQVISWNTGVPMRKQGNEIRVIEIAGIIEQYKPHMKKTIQ